MAKQASKSAKSAAAAVAPVAPAAPATPATLVPAGKVPGIGAVAHNTHGAGQPQAYAGHGQVADLPIGHTLAPGQAPQIAALAAAAAAMLAAGYKPAMPAPSYKLGKHGSTLSGTRGHVHALLMAGNGDGAVYAMAWQLCPPLVPPHKGYGLSAGTPSGFMGKARKRGQIA